MSGHAPDSFYVKAMRRIEELERENEALRGRFDTSHEILKQATKHLAQNVMDLRNENKVLKAEIAEMREDHWQEWAERSLRDCGDDE